MFQYEYEKRPHSSSSYDSQATVSTDWSRSGRKPPAVDITSIPRRPLPPRPIVCERIPSKTAVPLKVWIVASASCFAVCAALVLATLVITKWGTRETYTTRELYAEPPESIYTNFYPKQETTEHDITTSTEDNDIPVFEKLSIFKNIVANRENKKLNLINKPQIHPLHDFLHHEERKIEKKDQPKMADKHGDDVQNGDDLNVNYQEFFSESKVNPHEEIQPKSMQNDLIETEIQSDLTDQKLPIFKPIINGSHLPENYLNVLKQNDFEDYYNDENLYDDYMESNTMTSYLIEKVQELHDWVTKDPDFDVLKNSTNPTKNTSKNNFSEVLKALNESLIDGNVTIIMNKLKDIYFGENYTRSSQNRKVLLTNSTDLLSFGILTLDVMLLHNIQLMAWESQEAARAKMMKDPDVFAFNALFLDPSKIEAKHNEIQHSQEFNIKRQNHRQETAEDFNFGKNLFENILEVGMSTARAAIHLGRAYKNARLILTKLSSNKETLNTNIQNQISRNVDDNTDALNRLQTSYNKTENVTNTRGEIYTELDCIWLLYCKNLVATSKLNAPYGTMARINGMALRMITGDLSADKALDAMLYELLTGWTDLKCTDMFPRCSQVDAASVVMETLLQPIKKQSRANNT
ncbi:hypothetical protein K1T71_014759 [Dendrolimus kikuchii]|nr:hypothetical protein K1T71_014759 [Dendrolimus kikuchii]